MAELGKQRRKESKGMSEKSIVRTDERVLDYFPFSFHKGPNVCNNTRG